MFLSYLKCSSLQVAGSYLNFADNSENTRREPDVKTDMKNVDD